MLLWGGLSHYGKALGGAPNAFAAFLIANAAGSYLVELIYVFLAVFALRLVWQSRAEGGLWWKLPAVLAGLPPRSSRSRAHSTRSPPIRWTSGFGWRSV